jgi:hypothetical protein
VATFVSAAMLRSPEKTTAGGRTVASYFDSPPPWPGPAWRHGNRTASWPELDASAGPSHCGWQSLTFLTLGWPLGNSSPTAPAREYIRDPYAHTAGLHLRGTWEHNPKLPSDARDTRYSYGTIKLYFAVSDTDQYVYLVAPGDSERWPRSDPMTSCLQA